jgi:hypothetical protein
MIGKSSRPTEEGEKGEEARWGPREGLNGIRGKGKKRKIGIEK